MPVRTLKRTLSNVSDSDGGARTKRARVDKRKNYVDLNDAQIRSILREVSTGGNILVCGQGDVGQLGLGEDVMEKSRFAVVPEYSDVVAVAAGGMHNVCLTKDGKVLTFGCNDEGALGRDTSEEGSETVPGFVELPAPAIQVTAGDSHSAALLNDGRVFVWGSFRDSHGSMGLFTKNSEKLPVESPLKRDFIKIASGSDHLVMLDNTRQVFTCGCGEQGQLGRLPEKKTDRHCRQGVSELLTPGQVHFKAVKHVEAENIWAGSYATFVKAMKKDEIYVFGLNNYNQIGLKGTEKQYHPKLSKTFTGKNWKQISSGQHHSIALDDQGRVFVIGRKEYGRLGLGSVESDAEELTPVPAFENVKCIDVAAGSAQSFAVAESGKLYAWGMGTSGQLGTGEEEDADEPQLINSKQLKDVKVLRVSGGGQHTIVLGTSTSKSDDAPVVKKQAVEKKKVEEPIKAEEKKNKVEEKIETITEEPEETVKQVEGSSSDNEVDNENKAKESSNEDSEKDQHDSANEKDVNVQDVEMKSADEEDEEKSEKHEIEDVEMAEEKEVELAVEEKENEEQSADNNSEEEEKVEDEQAVENSNEKEEEEEKVDDEQAVESCNDEVEEKVNEEQSAENSEEEYVDAESSEANCEKHKEGEQVEKEPSSEEQEDEEMVEEKPE